MIHPLFALIVLSASSFGHLFAKESPLTAVELASVELQTDLSPDAAKQLADQLEVVSTELAKYWGSPLTAKVKLCVVSNLSNWPTGAIPAEARKQIELKAGTTITERETLDGRVRQIRSTVYAFADGRTPQHEFVHAFCWQTFGRVGPGWYAEGMAEVFAYRREDAKGVQVPTWMLKYLCEEPNPPTPHQIIENDLGQRKLWQKYAYRWALCYLLSQHPQYAEKFQAFGKRLMLGERVDFLREYADGHRTLTRDFRQFLGNLVVGYQFPDE